MALDGRQTSAAALQRKLERREIDARRGRLGRGRYDALVTELAAVIRLSFEAGATASLFGLEGPLRHGLRSDLCLQGWRWSEADAMARELLADAFRAARAARPSWNEGQREWTIEAGNLIERTRCVRCHSPLPEGHHKFCNRLCATSHHHSLHYLRSKGDNQALELAIRRI